MRSAIRNFFTPTGDKQLKSCSWEKPELNKNYGFRALGVLAPRFGETNEQRKKS